jgi:hypothetical protein
MRIMDCLALRMTPWKPVLNNHPQSYHPSKLLRLTKPIVKNKVPSVTTKHG